MTLRPLKINSDQSIWFIGQCLLVLEIKKYEYDAPMLRTCVIERSYRGDENGNNGADNQQQQIWNRPSL